MEYLLYILFYSRIILHRRDIYPLINSFSISTLLLLSQYQLLKTTLIALQMRMVFFFSISLISFLWKERQRCLERQYAFRLLENSYVIVFAKTSSHKMLLNVFLNICNIQLQGRREVAQKSSQDEQTPLGNAISKVKIFCCEGSKPLEYDPKGMRSIILSWSSKSKLETKA